MRFEKGHKAATRQRIVEVASERFRKDGVAAVGIAGVMADAGLTHGGFYAHFGSKEDLVREAMVAAFEGAKNRPQPELKPGESALERRIRSYLRPAHRDTPERGCAAAALVAEVARHDPATREAFTRELEGIVERIAAQLPDGMAEEARKSTAIGIFGVMLGALQLSRAVADPALSDAILESGIQAALKLAACV
jgi:TetR/AcrR family transcriptional regulator, transcriptional repressor for nem operon